MCNVNDTPILVFCSRPFMAYLKQNTHINIIEVIEREYMDRFLLQQKWKSMTDVIDIIRTISYRWYTWCNEMFSLYPLNIWIVTSEQRWKKKICQYCHTFNINNSSSATCFLFCYLLVYLAWQYHNTDVIWRKAAKKNTHPLTFTVVTTIAFVRIQREILSLSITGKLNTMLDNWNCRNWNGFNIFSSKQNLNTIFCDHVILLSSDPYSNTAY